MDLLKDTKDLLYEIEEVEQDDGVAHIDLHGYSVMDAQKWVNRIIKSFYSNQNCNSIFFITGRGKHVNNNGMRGTLFKLFPQWLEDQNISHMIDECKPQIGAYVVILKTSVNKNLKSRLSLKHEVLYSLAEMGISSYQFYLGVKYYKGKGIKKDDKEAAKWFRKAAEQGISSAQLMLGFLYMLGMGVRQNSQEALRWYLKAAEQKNSMAMKNISMYHLTQKDYQQAKDWFHKAFEAGNADSANQIGIMYKFGIGISSDLQKAEEWYRKAAEAGSIHGKVNLGTCLLKIREKEKEGIKLIREAAIEGLADAQNYLGEAYFQGHGVSQDLDEAKKWWLKSAAQNAGEYSGRAQYSLGALTEDFEESLSWYEKAADNDIKVAQEELARIYRFKDEVKAFEFYKKAASDTKHYGYTEKGIPYAQYSLGECYEFGFLKVDKNLKKALKWYKEAAKQEYFPALARLGFIQKIQEKNLTLTQIQKKLKRINSLPTTEELNIHIINGAFFYPVIETSHDQNKRIMDPQVMKVPTSFKIIVTLISLLLLLIISYILTSLLLYILISFN